MAKFKMVLELDMDVAIHSDWVTVKRYLSKMFAEGLGGVQPIIEAELPKMNKPYKNRTYKVDKY